MKIIEKGKKFDKVGENMHLHFAAGEDNEPAYNFVGKVNIQEVYFIDGKPVVWRDDWVTEEEFNSYDDLGADDVYPGGFWESNDEPGVLLNAFFRIPIARLMSSPSADELWEKLHFPSH